MKNIIILMLLLLPFIYHPAKAQNTNNTAVNQVLQSYLTVEKALVNDDSKMANTNASALVKAIKQVKVAQLDGGQKTAWTNYSDKLSYNAQHISESKSIVHQREHFASLSDEMYSLLKTFKTSTTVYRQYCPMKKQYWLNASANIQNPYYGKEMPDCGKVTETIKATAP